jgi:hypothetical protein
MPYKDKKKATAARARSRKNQRAKGYRAMYIANVPDAHREALKAAVKKFLEDHTA